MRKALALSFCAALLFILAAPAQAFVACEDCGGAPSGAVCAGFCDGMVIKTCGDWRASSCSNLLPAELPQPQLTASCSTSVQSAPEPVETEGPQLVESLDPSL